MRTRCRRLSPGPTPSLLSLPESAPAAEGDDAAAGEAATPPGDPGTEQIQEAAERIGELNDELNKLGLPIGWPEGTTINLVTIFGWLLTALAVSLGAPFWFDLLSKFIRIRGSGTPPPEGTTTIPVTAAISAGGRGGVVVAGQGARP